MKLILNRYFMLALITVTLIFILGSRMANSQTDVHSEADHAQPPSNRMQTPDPRYRGPADDDNQWEPWARRYTAKERANAIPIDKIINIGNLPQRNSSINRSRFEQPPRGFDVRTGIDFELLPSNDIDYRDDEVEEAISPGSGQLNDNWPEGFPERQPQSFSSLVDILDTKAEPYSRVVKVFYTIPGQGGFVCSGALIDPAVVLTAGHCVHDGHFNWYTDFEIIPAWNQRVSGVAGVAIVNSEPFGTAQGVLLHSWPYDFDTGDIEGDLAVIELDRPVGSLSGWFGLGASNTCSTLTGRQYTSAGYPGEGSYDGSQMVRLDGTFDWCGSGLARFEPSRTFGGQSGSGYWERQDQIIRSVHSASGDTDGDGILESIGAMIEDDEYNSLESFQDDAVPDEVDLIPLGMTLNGSLLGKDLNAVAVTPNEQFQEVRFRLLNYSSQTFQGSITATIYLSSNRTITENDTSLGAFTWNGLDLGPKSGAWLFLPNPPAIPPGTPSGNYYIGAIVADTPGEYDTSNNQTQIEDVAQLTVDLDQDHFTTPKQLVCLSCISLISNQYATKETGEPNHAGNAGGASLWWSWTAPKTGRIAIDTLGSDFNTLLAVYMGSDLQGLSLVEENDDIGGLVTSEVTFNAVAGQTYRIAVDGYSGATGNAALNLELLNPQTFVDYDGDGQTDISVWRPSNGLWYVIPSASGSSFARHWGLAGDVPTPGDYDGDGQTDLSVWRPSNGRWYVIPSSSGSSFARHWGLAGDMPTPGDYDGDGQTDLSIWRPSNGLWYVLPSSGGSSFATPWGLAGDVPTPGDYDGDGQTDLSVWRPSNGLWYVIPSSGGSRFATPWGLAGDIPTPGDYDGDGQTDLSVWRPSNGLWYVLPSSGGSNFATPWGLAGDIPAPGDYDGDGQTDIGVWRPSNGMWYVLPSGGGSTFATPWGLAGDIPIAP